MQPPHHGLWFRGPSPHVNSLTMRKAAGTSGKAPDSAFRDVLTSITPGNPDCRAGSPKETGLGEGRVNALSSV